MREFYEKANEKILVKCKNFIANNLYKKNEYNVYREALTLSCELIDSILESQEGYNNEIAKLSELKIEGMIGAEYRTVNGFEFHYLNDILYLYFDKEAHEILEQLELIQNSNEN